MGTTKKDFSCGILNRTQGEYTQMTLMFAINKHAEMRSSVYGALLCSSGYVAVVM